LASSQCSNNAGRWDGRREFHTGPGAERIPVGSVGRKHGQISIHANRKRLQIYSIDQTSGALTLLSGPLAAFAFAKGTVVADPMGPFVYSLTRAGVDVFQVDPQTGDLAEIPGAPFGTGSSAAMGSLGLAISGSPTQNVSGPAAQLFPVSTDFGPTTVARASGTKII
jgi:hypothetical protein